MVHDSAGKKLCDCQASQLSVWSVQVDINNVVKIQDQVSVFNSSKMNSLQLISVLSVLGYASAIGTIAIPAVVVTADLATTLGAIGLLKLGTAGVLAVNRQTRSVSEVILVVWCHCSFFSLLESSVWDSLQAGAWEVCEKVPVWGGHGSAQCSGVSPAGGVNEVWEPGDTAGVTRAALHWVSQVWILGEERGQVSEQVLLSQDWKGDSSCISSQRSLIYKTQLWQYISLK